MKSQVKVEKFDDFIFKICFGCKEDKEFVFGKLINGAHFILKGMSIQQSSEWNSVWNLIFFHLSPWATPNLVL